MSHSSQLEFSCSSNTRADNTSFLGGEKVSVMNWQREFGLDPIIGEMNAPWESSSMFAFSHVSRIITACKELLFILSTEEDSPVFSDRSVLQMDSDIIIIIG